MRIRSGGCLPRYGRPDRPPAWASGGAAGIQALQHRLGPRIGLLALDAPVFQLLERDRHPGDGAAHEGAGPQHAEITVEVADFRLPRHRTIIEAVEHSKFLCKFLSARADRGAAHAANIMPPASQRNPWT